MTPTRRVVRAWMLEQSKALPQPRRVLEIGISGDDPPGANREFFKAVESYETADNNAELKPDHVFDLEDIPHDPALHHAFDLVICSQTLEHVWAVEAAAWCLWLLTAFGGRCLVDLPFLMPPHRGTAEDTTPDYWRMTPACLDRLLQRAGFFKVTAMVDPAWLNVFAVAEKGQCDA